VAGKLLESAPRRDVIAANLDANAFVALVDGPEQAIGVVNLIGPEHLELMTSDPEALVPLVRNAGAVFCGPFAPASVGDYVAGPNHVLPTYGSARWAGALRVDDFQKHIHVVSFDEDALAGVAPFVAAMAEAEGLPTHAESVRIRGNR
jgi:histidinol dehydrogenase